MTSSGSTSPSLLADARAAVPEAWLKLNRVYGPLVYQWCRRYGVSEHDAADVVQEVFRSLLTNLESFRLENGGPGFRAWIRSITTNKVRDFFRSSGYRKRAPGGCDRMANLPVDNETDSTQTEEEAGIMQRVLPLVQMEFEETTWRAFWRCTVEGASSTLVADELGISSGAVRQAKYRVLRRLRDEISELT